MGGCHSKPGRTASRSQSQLHSASATAVPTSVGASRIASSSMQYVNGIKTSSNLTPNKPPRRSGIPLRVKPAFAEQRNLSEDNSSTGTLVNTSRNGSASCTPSRSASKASTPSTTLDRESGQMVSDAAAAARRASQTASAPPAPPPPAPLRSKYPNGNRLEGKWRVRPAREAPYRATATAAAAALESSALVGVASRLRTSVTDSALCSSLREMEALKQADTYRNYKQRRQSYISRPRTCSDNFQPHNYSRSNSNANSSASEAEESLPAAAEAAAVSHDLTPQQQHSSVEPVPLPSTSDSVVEPDLMEKANPPRKGSSNASSAFYYSSLSRKGSSNASSTFNCSSLSRSSRKGTSFSKASSTGSATNSLSRSPRKRSVNLLLSKQSKSAARPVVNNSVTSLNSDDLMLTTEIDEPDDDIIKDIDDTEKEDPFLAEATDGASLPSVPDIMSASYPAPAHLLQSSEQGRPRGGSGSGSSSSSSLMRTRSVSGPLRPPLSQLRRERTFSTGSQEVKLESLREEDQVSFSAADLRYVTQDMTSLKTLLLRLKRLLLEDEEQSSGCVKSFGILRQSSVLSEPGTPMSPQLVLPEELQQSVELSDASTSLPRPSLLQLAEQSTREELLEEVALTRQEVLILRQQLEEKDTSIRLLQCQMVCS